MLWASLFAVCAYVAIYGAGAAAYNYGYRTTGGGILCLWIAITIVFCGTFIASDPLYGGLRLMAHN